MDLIKFSESRERSKTSMHLNKASSKDTKSLPRLLLLQFMVAQEEFKSQSSSKKDKEDTIKQLPVRFLKGLKTKEPFWYSLKTKLSCKSSKTPLTLNISGKI